MTIREQAKRSFGFDVAGKLTRMPDVFYGVGKYQHGRLYMDEAGNEYHTDSKGRELECIVTVDGGVM